MPRKQKTKRLRRWVVKAGSQMVCSGGPLLVREWMQQVAHLKKYHQVEVIWVTSGAIVSAVDRTDFAKNKRGNSQKKTLPEKQALSAIGQPMVMDLYNLAINAQGLIGAQVLLTRGDIKDLSRRKNLQNTLEKLLQWNAVPILNENDAVATEEIQFGDNDSLSAQIARMVKAERLVLLTDVNGLYDKDPKNDKSAELISYKKSLSAADLGKVKNAKTSSRGTGGMYSKLLAAQTARESGITTHLLKGDIPQNLLRLAKGEKLGTQIGGKP